MVVMDWRLCWRHAVMEVRGIGVGGDRGARIALSLALASEVMEGDGVWQWQGGSDVGDEGQQRVPMVRWHTAWRLPWLASALAAASLASAFSFGSKRL